MKLHDISVPISASLPLYAGDPPTLIEPWTRIAAGDTADLSRLSLGSHTGTHIDAPSHFIPGGPGIDAIDLEWCIGPAEVVDLTAAGCAPIDASLLAAHVPAGTRRLLCKTANSRLWRGPRVADAIASLTPDAAHWLVQRGIRLAGIDYLSIAPLSDPAPVHRILLTSAMVVLEGLDLSEVAAGHYTLICLPLRLPQLDGAPCRAVLIEGAGPAE